MNMWWDTPSVRKLHRTKLIKAWFENLEQTDGGPGMVLMTWETLMPVDEWWDTILEMVRLAPDERSMGSIAAGPLEHLLVRHGAEVIEMV
jgi:hypothetical protein